MHWKTCTLYWVLTLLFTCVSGLTTHYANLGTWGWVATISVLALASLGFAGWVEVVVREDESWILKAWKWILQNPWAFIADNAWAMGLGAAGLIALIIATYIWPWQMACTLASIAAAVGCGALVRFAWIKAKKPPIKWCLVMFIAAILSILTLRMGYEWGWKTNPVPPEPPADTTATPPAKADPIADWKQRVAELQDILGGDFQSTKATVKMPWNAVPAGRRAGIESKAKEALKQLEKDFGGDLEGATITKVVSAEFFFEAGGVRRARAWAVIKGKSGLLYKGLPTSIEIAPGWDSAATAVFAAEALDSMKPLPTR